MAAVRIECAIRQHQPDLSGQHRHLLRRVNRCQRIHSHGWPRARRQAWRNPQRHLRSRRLAARRPIEQPRQPQSYLLRPAAPLLTITTMAFGIMPETTFIIQGEPYGYFHRDHSRIWARGADRARVRAGIQEVHPQRIRRTRVPRGFHPVRHYCHRCHRRIRRYLHVGHRARRSSRCGTDRVYARQPKPSTVSSAKAVCEHRGAETVSAPLSKITNI